MSLPPGPLSIFTVILPASTHYLQFSASLRNSARHGLKVLRDWRFPWEVRNVGRRNWSFLVCWKAGAEHEKSERWWNWIPAGHVETGSGWDQLFSAGTVQKHLSFPCPYSTPWAISASVGKPALNKAKAAQKCHLQWQYECPSTITESGSRGELVGCSLGDHSPALSCTARACCQEGCVLQDRKCCGSLWEQSKGICWEKSM